MKKILIILSATALFAACKQKNLTDSANFQQQLDSLKQAQQTEKTQTVVKPVYRTRTVYSSQPVQSTTQKHGMRRSTKNALIGAGVGAATGAIISKDGSRVKGAVIGGALGAGAGYIYGKHREKKYGKY
jgi:outer membrane lipoprotein SlyB